MRLLLLACMAMWTCACDDYHLYTVTGRVLDPDGGGVGGVQVLCRLASSPLGGGYGDKWHPTTSGSLCPVDGGCGVPVDGGAGEYSCTVDQLNVNSTAPQTIVVTANPPDAGVRDVRFGTATRQVQVPDQGTATANVTVPAVP